MMSPRRSAPERKQQRKLPIWLVLGGVAVIAVLFVVIAVDLATKLQPRTPAASASTLSGIPINGKTMGDAAAPITLVEFFDFQ